MCAAIAILMLSTNLSAQEPARRSAESAKKKALKIEPWVSLTSEFDNNLFLLSPARRQDLAGSDGADPSGRFKNMNSVSDLMVESSAGIHFLSRGWSGRELTIAPEIRYERFMKNSERSNLTAALGFTQLFRRNSRLRGRITYNPEYFAKNYLSDAVDANGNGTISSGERRYSAGKYSDLDIDLDFRFRLRKAPKRGGSGIHAAASLGYYSRSYEAPFAGRNLSGPRAGLEVGFDRSRSGLDLSYVVDALSAEPGTEILILDEPVYSRDLNGNGRSTDLNARTAQQVDRSRNEHRGTVSLKLEPKGAAAVRLGFEHRLRIFSSDLPFDVAHRGRRDRRNEVRGDVSLKMGRRLRFITGGRMAKQTTNRGADRASLGETDDFVRARAYAGLRKAF